MAASILGDPSQQIFDDTVLPHPFGTAFRDLYRLMQKLNLQRAQREVYYTLPAYTNILVPSQAAINDMGDPVKLWERGTLSSASVSGVSDTTPIVVTVGAGHPFATNDEVVIDGVLGPTGRVNGKWFVTVGGNNLTLNGSIAAGTYSPGGTATKSSEDFSEMASRAELPQTDPTGQLNYWKWEEDVLWFRPSIEARQLLIEYESSGDAPTSGVIGIDDSLDYLAYRTAGLAGPMRGRTERGNQATVIAVGPSGRANGRAGLLHDLIAPMLQEKQKRAKRPLPFRPRRNPV